MHIHLLTTLALLSPALCNPRVEPLPAALAIRSPLDTTVEPLPSTSPSFSPYFIILNFEVFLASPLYPTMHSRALFNLSLAHPDPAQRWNTTCLAHMAGDICNTTDFLPCQAVGDERLGFKLSTELGRVEIRRLWAYNGMHMTTMASEGTYWSENGSDRNVTESEYGKLYERAAEWMFAWKSTVG